MKANLHLCLLLALLTVGCQLSFGQGAKKVTVNPIAVSKPTTTPAEPVSNAQEALHFVENKGQWAGQDLFRAEGYATTIQIMKRGFMLSQLDEKALDALAQLDREQEEAHAKGLAAPKRSVTVNQHAWMVEFVGMSPTATMETKSTEKAYYNYFIGNDPNKWASNVHSYQEVWYKEIYANVDARLYAGNGVSLEYDLVAKPGADISKIKLRYTGLNGIRIDKNGQLVITTIFGETAYPAPVAYQTINGKKVTVKCAYTVSGENVIGFTAGAYDKSQTVVIDPIALRWATFLSTASSTANNHHHGIEVDASGNVYSTGKTDATNFPTTTGVITTTYTGSNTRGFLTKLNQPVGVNGAGSYAFSTYFGGSSLDNPYSIKLDAAGNIYICGVTNSSDFPHPAGGYGSYQGGEDAFVIKINNRGTAIIYSAIIGGSKNDEGDFLYVNSAGEVYLAGLAGKSFPTTANAYQGSFNSNSSHAFWCQLNAAGSSLLYSTIYGGSGSDVFTCVRPSGTNALIFSGTTTSSSSIATAGAFQSTYAGSGSGMVVKFDISGANPTLMWGSYINGASGKTMQLLSNQVDASGNIYVGGITTGASTTAITTGAYQTIYGGGTHDLYLGKLSADGASLLAGTYIGGSDDEVNFMGINIDTYGDVYGLGYTKSTNLITTSGAMQLTNFGGQDAIFLKMSADYTTMKYLSYWGGTADETDPIGFDGIKFSDCRAYTALTVNSQDAPMTKNAFNTPKTSATTVSEPAVAVWSNPPDLTGDNISGNETVCYGAVPDTAITGTAASYVLSDINRNGTISAQNSPGVITYSWQKSTDMANWTIMVGSVGQSLTTLEIGALTQTTYFQRIIGGDFCQGAIGTTITKKISRPAVTFTTDNVSCNGRADGSLVANVSGGITPYVYHWNTGATTQTISSLAPATYTVSVTDAAGCTATVASAGITQPAVLVATVGGANVTCNAGTNGTVTTSVSGGTSPYTYLWTGGATTSSISGKAAGSYSVTITDANGCSLVKSRTITQPAAIVVTLTGTNVGCRNATTGAVTSATTGGTGAYTYLWSNGATTQNIASMAAGTYTVTVTDASGCTGTASKTLTQPTAVLAVTLAGTNLTCNANATGAVTSTVTGGTAAYTYLWSNAATTANLSGLAAGTYNVTVTDANGCTTASASAKVVTQPATLTVSATGAVPPTCNGLSNGSINSTVAGGTAAYTYVWSNGATTANLTGIATGTYNVTVTDANGCSAATTNTTTNVTQPATLTVATTGAVSPSCFGSSNGSINSTVTGGTAPYTYHWNTNATTANLTGIPTGTYNVTVTDANGCSAATTNTITNVTQPALLTVAATGAISPTCNGLSNGSINSTVTGGTTPYTYIWNTGATTANLTGILAGTYNVTVTDAHGCTVATNNTTINVTQPGVLGVAATGAVPPSCFGSTNGSINSTITGGTAPYTYVWNTGATTANLTGIPAGTYNVTVTDAHGCTVATNNTTINVTQPSVLTVAATGAVPPTCNGLSNGSINSTVTGGTAPYTYHWNTNATTANLTGIPSGTYNVTVTDANGCSAATTNTVTNVTQPAVLTVAATGAISPTCNGLSNGSINSTVTGGTAPYTYVWNTGAITANLTGIPAGTYNVTVTDAHGCTVATNNTTINVMQPATLTVAATGAVPPTCNGLSNGSINSTVTGGTTPYTYHWNTNATTANLTGIPTGTYNVTVTDANGCSAATTNTVTNVTQPAVLTVAATGAISPTCNGLSNGSINSTVTGGSAPYTYHWNTNATTANLTGIPTGTYNVTVTDANGCSAATTNTVTNVTQPATLTVAATGAVPPTCNGLSNGSINSTVTGGTAPYTYHWNTNATTANLTGIPTGTYNVTVTDANGCSAATTNTVTNVTQPGVLTVAATGAISPTCNGLSNGSINSTVTGGTAPYTYVWNTGAITANLTGIPAGTYNVTVTDAHGCTVATNNTTINVMQPATLTVAATGAVPPTCNGLSNGSINSTVTGGTTPYTYHWNTNATTANLTGIPTGTYNVTVTDANGCSAATTNTVTNVTQPAVLTVAATGAISPTCNGLSNGSINSTVSGGTAPYTYVWNTGATTANLTGIPAGTYNVTVTDAHGCTVATNNTTINVTQPATLTVAATGALPPACNGLSNGSINSTVTGGTTPYTYHWNTNATTANLTGIPTGTYNVTVTDANGCSAATTNTVTNVTQPAVLTVAATGAISPTCNGLSNGSINSTVSGGTTPYTYVWNTGATTANLTGIPAGTYNVTVTDAHGCTVATNNTTINVTQPATLTVAATGAVPPTCNGLSNGSINSTVTGGTAPYTYHWNNNATTANLTGIPTGTYNVTVTDANGCSAATTNTVTNVTQPGVLTLVLTANNPACNGSSTGSISSVVTGGTTAYTYHWSNNTSNANLTNAPSGTYSVTVTDAHGCSTTGSKTLSDVAALTVSLTPTNPACNGNSNGSITTTISGGNGSYTYVWSNGATTSGLSGLAIGTFSVTVNDALGCAGNASVTLTQPATLTVAATGAVPPTCNGLSNGSINSTVTGGTTPYTYHWNTNATTANLTGIPTGTYNVTVTDANGCSAATTNTVTNVTQPAVLTVAATGAISPTCNGLSNGSINSTVSGGTAPYTYVWNTGATTANLTGIPAGTYNVTVTDAHGCTVATNNTTINVTQPAALTVATTGAVPPTCNGLSNGSINSTVTGGTAPYTYHWNTNATTANLTGIPTGTYNVTVTDANGCSAATTNTVTNVTQPGVLTVAATGAISPTCNGLSNGSINSTVTGGTAPYTYVWNTGAITANLTGIPAGTYNVTVTDAHGCTVATNNTTINVMQPATLTVAATGAVPPTCNGLSNGSINSTVTGGTTPYTYHWNTNATTANLTGIPTGTYNVTVTDANGCSAATTNTVTNVTQPAVLTVAATGAISPTCNGLSNGSINSTVSGGTAPYTYVWNTGATTANLTGIPAGTYNVTVTDAHGCTVATNNTTINVTQPATLTVAATGAVPPTCNGLSNGSINSTVTGGTAPYTYHWNTNATTANLTGIPTGTYNVTVTDANGCSAATTNTVTNVTQPAVLTVAATGAVPPSCNGLSNGSINSTVGGGTAPFTYVWNTGATTANLTGIPTGTYNVTVTDANGCTAATTNTTTNVTQPTVLGSTTTTSNISCFGAFDGSATVTPSGGTSPYTYHWSNNATTQTITGKPAGNYPVTITDANGCTKLDTAHITQPGLLTLGATTTPVYCAGGNNGAIDLTVTGGTSPFVYTWSNGATTQDIAGGLVSGTYNVTVVDAHNCSATVAINVAQTPALTVSATGAVSPTCFGSSNGSINSTVVGGTAPFTYLWSTGTTTANISGLPAGTYNVTVTDAHGCTAATSNTTTNVTQPALLTSTTSTNNISCFGAFDGSATVTPSGGTSPYTYHWSNNATTQTITGKPAGNYPVTITDANGCTKLDTARITQPGLLTLGATTTPVYCAAGNNGAIDLTVTGGTSPFVYTWSNGATTQDIAGGLVSGTYNVTVVDAHNCSATVAITVAQTPGLTVSATGAVSPTCFGASNGSINSTVVGGTAPFTYLWSNGATTANLTGITTGTYNVTVTDAHGCTAATSNTTTNVTQPALLTVAATGAVPPSCNGLSNGSINSTVAGGTAPYTYHWNTGATTANLTGIPTGTYNVTVTDAHGCIAATTNTIANVTQPAVLTVAATGAVPPSCNGLSNGSINSTVAGGTAPYTYVWSTGATTANLTAIPTGTYNVTVTDAHGCTASTNNTTINVTQPTVLTSSTSTSNISCFGAFDGSATVTAAGGTTPYTYHWSNNATTATITGKPAGNYPVTITDANGCTKLDTARITQPGLLTLGANTTPVSCFGGSNGAIDLTVSGGTSPFTYTWSNGATTQDIAALASGTYNVTVVDGHNCSATVAIGTTVTQPAQLIETLTSINPACNGASSGSITSSVTGGTTPYTYHWSNNTTAPDLTNTVAGTYSVTVTDANGCSTVSSATLADAPALNVALTSVNPKCNGARNGTVTSLVTGGTGTYTYHWSTNATTANLTTLGIGTYAVTVNDAAGCTGTASVTLTQPAALVLTLTATNPACFGTTTGSITTTVTGGTAPYAYTWTGGATTPNRTNLGIGTYGVIVTDSNGCAANGSKILTQPAVLASTTSTVNISCFGAFDGSATVTATGGTSPYTYHWSNNATTTTITGKPAGLYPVTITDSHGCIKLDTARITQPGLLTLGATSTSVSCYGGSNGSIDLTVTGGTSPFTYTWSNGATTQDISGLISGTYQVTVVDAHNCSATVATGTSVTQPALLTTILTANNPACNGASTGSITTATAGGTTPYTYHWSNNSTNADLTNAPAGTYGVTITDANGCSTTGSKTLTDAPALTLSLSTINPTCSGTRNGSINSTVTGGTGTYNYLWSTNATTASLTTLGSGSYSLTVTDVNGCTATASVTLTQPGTLAVTLTSTNPACFGNATGSINTNVTGGTAPFSYTWTNGATTPNITNVVAGNYGVIVTDSNNCAVQASRILTQPAVLASTTTTSNISCFGAFDGSATVTATGGTSPYTYHWSNNATTTTITGKPAGNYPVTITDAHGCTKLDTARITQPGPLTLGANTTPVSCNGGHDGAIDLTVTGGTAAFVYTWSTGATTQDISGLTVGTYHVTVVDAHNCSATVAINVTEPLQLSATGVVTNAACNSNGNGGVVLTVVGGNIPYTYTWSNGQTTKDLTNVVAGNYDVNVVDFKGCTIRDTFTITQPGTLAATAIATNVSCNGLGNGSITLAVTGGTTPYTYAWTNGAATQNISSLVPGTYNVTVTDAHGCSTIAGATTITQPATLTASATSTSALCFGAASGTVTLTVNGGTTAYTYVWSNGATTQNLSGVAAGTYTVTVTDANHCTATASTTITTATALTGIISVTNARCSGENNGALAVTANGGTTPYTYLWSNGATTAAINNITAGTYTVTITDAHSCTKVATATVGQPQAVAITGVVVNAACNNSATGSVTLTVTGGNTGSFTYNWSNGATTKNITNVAAGTYKVTATDARGCIDSATFVVSEASSLTSSISTVSALCFGSFNGSATVTVTGGTAPYTYHWSTNATTATITGRAAGNYPLTITDANGCRKLDTAHISQPGLLTLGAITTPVSCNAGNDGAVDLTVTGGTPSFTYHWSTGATTQDLTGLTAGGYRVTVTDAHNCSATVTIITVSEPQQLVATGVASANNCNGDSTGSVVLTATGGNTPFTYAWSNGQTTKDLTSVPSGNYTVVVTDNKGCVTYDTFNVVQPQVVSATTTTTPASCNGNSTGTATATGNGGTAPYTYVWSNGQTTATATGLPAGTHTVTVTDAHGCISTAIAAVVSEPAALATTTSTIPANCNGSSNGSLAVTVTGGTTPYTYLWTNGSVSAAIGGLTAGAYTVTVTDANNCTIVATDTVHQPTSIVLTSVITNVICAGEATGAIDLTATGGSPTYTYHWSNNATTEDLSGIRSGIYKVTVTDTHGCTATHADTVRQSPGIVISVVTTPAGCNGDTSGSARVTVSGGHPPYHISWPNGDTTITSTGYAAGSYAVGIRDSTGCTKFANFLINQPNSLVSSATATNVVCNGAATATAYCMATGGTAPYTCTWSNGATGDSATHLTAGTYYVTTTDAHGCSDSSRVVISEPAPYNVLKTVSGVHCNGLPTGSVSLLVSGNIAPYTFHWNNGSSAQNLSSLAAGTYFVTITDANGCNKFDTANISQPDSLHVNATVTNATCYGVNNGAINATVVGGTMPYSFTWTRGTFTSHAQNPTGLAAGTYNLTMNDAGGCSILMVVNVGQPAAITSTITSTNVHCNGGNGGAATVSASGGTPSYTYHWSNNSNNANTSGLSVGTYKVTITDLNGCTRVDSVVITQPAPLALTSRVTAVSCNGGNDGEIELEVHGGTSGYNYSWSNGDNDDELDSLTAGTYTVVVNDANNCTANTAIQVSQPQPIAITGSVTPATCNGSNDGGATIAVTGGTSPYTYVWSNGQTTKDLTNAIAGTYIVTVTDNAHCTSVQTFNVTQPQAMVMSGVVSNVTCNGASNASITVAVTGATGSLSYLWSTGTNMQDLTNVGPGTYSVTASSSIGCAVADTFTVTEPAALQVQVTPIDVLCNSGATGSVSLTVTGGTVAYTYQWNNGETGNGLANKPAGIYEVTVTDAHGCIMPATATINELAGISVALPVTNVNCYGGTDGAVTAQVTGGTGSYSYAWSTGSHAANITGLVFGTYKVTITDGNGCSRVDSARVTQPGPLTLGATTTPVNCYGSSTGAIDLTASGPYPPFTYYWSTNETTEDISGLVSGTYHVTVTNTHNCSATVSINVSQPQPITLSGTVAPACGGNTNGSVTLAVIGGTSPYHYNWSNGQSTKDLINVGGGVYSVVVSDSNLCTATNTFSVNQLPSCGQVSYRMRVMLEGPYDSTLNQMTTSLNALGVLPLSQPYGVDPTLYQGNESVATMPSDITDWVLVSFRTSLIPSSTIYTFAGLMDKNGYVHLVNGDSVVTFNSGAGSALYIVVQHRNHMGIMTATPVTGYPSNINVPLTDFTRMQTYQSGVPVTSGQKVVATDVRGPIYAMHSGDGDANFDINSNDFLPLVTNFNHFNIYLSGDFNMDGDINSNDIPFWIRNFNLFSGVQH